MEDNEQKSAKPAEPKLSSRMRSLQSGRSSMSSREVLRSRLRRAFVLRAPQEVVSEVIAGAKAAVQVDSRRPVNYERPGDVVVSRDLRSVYTIAKDGSRRRCNDPELFMAAVATAKAA